MEGGMKTKCMEKVSCSGPMAKDMRANSKTTRDMGMESITGQMAAAYTMASGSMESSTASVL